MFLKVSITWILLLSFSSVSTSNVDKICMGSKNGLSHSVSSTEQYEALLNKYYNCTIVKGNLEITGLTVSSFDLSFLQNIEWVTGYVIIAFNSLPHLPLENLKMIGGEDLFQDRYSLFITGNDNNQENSGMDLRLKSLAEIVTGSIYINQNKFCFLHTINWNDILNPALRMSSKVLAGQKPPKSCERERCDSTCEGRCWGAGPSMCQSLTSTICARECGTSRCRGPSVDECCDRECAIGCTGSTDNDCIACLHVNDSGQCKASCPAHTIYDPETKQYIPNPNIKYRYMDTCVERCPGELLIEDGHCVHECKVNFQDNGEGKCVPCENGVCVKECYGVGHERGPTKGQITIDSNNIHFFEGCKKIKGNLIFLAQAFTGDRYYNIPPLNISQLRLLHSIKVVTGYVLINNWHRQLRDFSILQNLERIQGTELYRKFFALVIVGGSSTAYSNYLSQITSLGFRSLKQITRGNVYISQMKNLCYDRKFDWTRIIQHPISHVNMTDGIFRTRNRPSSKCYEAECNPECTSDGCWGPGPLQCLSCRHASYNGACVRDCSQVSGIALYQVSGETECRRCHPQCRSSCFGEGPDHCIDCLHFRDGQSCVERCPGDKYLESRLGKCLPCHSACLKRDDRPLCTGPNATFGEGGCTYCDYIVQERGVLKCTTNQEKCPPSHFTKPFTLYNFQLHACLPCYVGCETCSGPSRDECS